jgi:ribosomal protein S18 acetylase RimI-like enzyme
MTADITIRSLEGRDRTAVLALWEICGLTVPWNSPAGDLDRALAGTTSDVLVAEDAAGTVIGSVMLGDDGHRGWIYYLSVDPARQNSGLGRALMAAGEDWLRTRGVRKVELMVRRTNERVLGFYNALGYATEPVTVLSHWLVDDPRKEAP